MALEVCSSPRWGSVAAGGPKLIGMLGTLDIFWKFVAGWPALETTGLIGTTGVSLGDKPVGCLIGVFIGLADPSKWSEEKGFLWDPSTKSNPV